MENLTEYYWQDFLDKYGFVFCELCKRSDQLRYSVHHLVYRSQQPNHPKLHDSANLALLCESCHANAHAEPQNEALQRFKAKKGTDTLFKQKSP